MQTQQQRDEPMRVLFLSDHLGYANGVTHGATTYFMSVLPQLASDDVELTVCFLRERHEAADGLEGLGIKPLFLNRGKWDPRAVSDLLAIIRERGIEIVHSAGMKGILMGSIAGRLGNCRNIIHLHDTRHPGMVVAGLQRLAMRWASLALVVSGAVGELAVQTFGVPPSRVITMYNPLDIRRFAQVEVGARQRLRNELNIAADAMVIGMTGRLSSEKGHQTMLSVLPRILEQCPGAVLLVAGDGPMRGACERMIDQLGLRQAVRLLGNRSDIPEILAAVDVVVIPSSREGLSYSAMEAMAAGRPVVAFAVGGLIELLEDGRTGLLVEAADAAALTDAIVRLLKDGELAPRLVVQAREKIRNFSISSHVAQLKGHYRSVLDQVEKLESVAT